MNNRMRDYMMRRGGDMRDMRNPYGSQGGYVSSRRPGRDRAMNDRNSYYAGEFYGMSDNAMSGDFARGRRDYGNDYGNDFARDRRDYDMGDTRDMRRRDYDMNDMRGRDYDMRRDRDYGDYRGDYDYMPYPDYASGNLSREELHHWKKKLYGEMEKSECEMMSEEKILKRAKEMGIKFEEFSEDEYVIAVLAMYTDYCKTLGKANLEMYLKLAKDFLEDKDAGVKYGEKLAAYYDNIVNV